MLPSRQPPNIALFAADLMVAARVQETCASLGCQVEWIEFDCSLEEALVDRISALHPALILFDLGSAGLPWKDWIARLKSTPATSRFPLVAFGAHVQVEALQAARSAGADVVMARSAFFAGLPDVIRKHARQADPVAIEAACLEPLSDLGRQGIDLFNRGEYFEAHEALEHAWNADAGPGRELYRALLQVAVAYLQIERGNYKGAVKMFWRLRQWINPLPGICRSVVIDQLQREVEQVYQALLACGSDGLDAFDRTLFRPIKLNEGQ